MNQNRTFNQRQATYDNRNRNVFYAEHTPEHTEAENTQKTENRFFRE